MPRPETAPRLAPWSRSTGSPSWTDRPSVGEVEKFLESAGPETRAVWLCLTRPGSKWSRLNISKVERLIGQGRMRPGGMAEVEAAQADGRWANPWT
jgi:hypothetical protein